MDNKPVTKQDVAQMIQQFFDANYKTGNPRVPPHQHNGVDNLQINATNILDLPKTAPGGVNTSVQFNNNGAFGGDTFFVYDSVDNILGIPNINSSIDPNNTADLFVQATFGSNATFGTLADPNNAGASGKIVINTDNDNSSGLIDIHTGNAATTTSGAITLKTGTGHTSSSHGKIVINTGGVTPPNNGNGSVTIYSQKTMDLSASGDNSATMGVFGAASSRLGSSGFVLIDATDALNTGNIRLRPVSQGPTAEHGNLSFGPENVSPNFGGGTGIFFIENVTTVPVSNPTGGGLLYVSAGALMYRGTAGTITTIAPA